MKKIFRVFIRIMMLFLAAGGICFGSIKIYKSITDNNQNKEKENIDIIKTIDDSDDSLQVMQSSIYTDTSEEIDDISDTEADISSVSFFVTGDNLIHESIIKYANVLAGGNGDINSYGEYGFDFKDIYSNLSKEIEYSDISIINQSSIVGANDSPSALSGYPKFNSPSKLGDDLVDLGFDVVNIASNHMMDVSEAGLISSMQYWDNKDAKIIGAYKNQSEYNDPDNKIIEKNGIKFGILSYICSTNQISYDKNKVTIPMIINILNGKSIIDSDTIANQIKACKDKSDFVIVLVNWANEAGYEVNDFERETAKLFASNGADMIIGTGPKVIQKMEYISVATRKEPVFCAYSLGNFLGTMQYMDNLFGGVLTFDVEMKDGKAILKNILLMPTVIHYDENLSNIKIYHLKDYNKELFDKHGSNIIYGFGEYDWYADTLKKYIDPIYLPENFR